MNQKKAYWFEQPYMPRMKNIAVAPYIQEDGRLSICVFGLDPLADGVVISHKEGHVRGIASNHGDPEHLWKGLGLAYTMDSFRKAVKAAMFGKAEGTQASVFMGLSDEAAAEKIGALCAEDMKTSGILASISAVQFILEAGYGRTELAQKANNCFGMKCVLSGNSWGGSAWDGTSKYRKKTQEDDGTGKLYTVTADFRKYACVEKSIADHSAYLLGAMNGKKKRYAELAGEKRPEKVFRPYLVRVEIPDLNIRKKPGTNQEKTGKYTGVDSFTIVAEADGVGASKWGLLKAYEKERDGWISLDYVTKIG